MTGTARIRLCTWCGGPSHRVGKGGNTCDRPPHPSLPHNAEVLSSARRSQIIRASMGMYCAACGSSQHAVPCTNATIGRARRCTWCGQPAHLPTFGGPHICERPRHPALPPNAESLTRQRREQIISAAMGDYCITCQKRGHSAPCPNGSRTPRVSVNCMLCLGTGHGERRCPMRPSNGRTAVIVRSDETGQTAVAFNVQTE